MLKNDIIFNKNKYFLCMQSVFRGCTGCTCGHGDIMKVLFRKVSLTLKAVALEIANRGESITS